MAGSLVFFDFVPMPRFLNSSSSSSSGGPVARPTATAAALGAAPLTAVSWNIAAINNNPFEYWVEIADPGYNELMANAQRFVDAPGAEDVRVDAVFTDAMFAELRAAMGAMQPAWTGVDEVAEIWATELSQRKIVSGFLKDKGIGKKRLISMPDRISNTVNTNDGATVYRPTAINCFPRPMATLDAWWAEWRRFMFDTPLGLTSRGKAVRAAGAAGLLSKIKAAKYPALSAREEAVSLPLQTLHLAVFDAIMVHMLEGAQPSAAAATGGWHGQRMRICHALNSRKNDRVLEILRESYAPAAHVVFLQEVAATFVAMARADPVLGARFHVLAPAELDGKRDQNSVVLCRKDTFAAVADAGAAEHTKAVMAQIKEDNAGSGKKVPVADGDVFAVTVKDQRGRPYFFASFHGDTNGLATIPVVRAVEKVSRATVVSGGGGGGGEPPTLVFGLDANTYVHGSAHMQGVSEFVATFAGQGLSSCWGDVVDPTRLTTFNGRTYVQPQLQKAMQKSETPVKGDVNPKDFIVFHKAQFKPVATTRDNTGARKYKEGMLFPTLSFPSDHAVISATLLPTNA